MSIVSTSYIVLFNMIHLPSITDPNIYLYESVQITLDLLILFLNLGMIKSWSTPEKKYTTWRHPPSMCFPIPAHFFILFTSLWVMQLLEIAWFDSIDLCDVVWCMHIGALWTFGTSIAWQHQGKAFIRAPYMKCSLLRKF